MLHAVPSRIEATTGLVTTLRKVFSMPSRLKLPPRAHSTEVVASVHMTSALVTSTSASDGTASSPIAAFAIGKPSITVLP
jgi:hypothetical protein